jgi:hypothetical protein
MNDDASTRATPPPQPPTFGPTPPEPPPNKDRTVHVAVIAGAFSVLAALVGYLGLPAVATPPTVSLPTTTVTATVTTTVTSTPTDTAGGASSPRGSAEPSDSQGPSSDGWITFFKDPLTFESTWTNLDENPPAAGLSDVKVVGYVDGVYLKAWEPQEMAKVPTGAADPAPLACADLIDASAPAANRLTVAPGDRVCLRTDRKRIALIRITNTTVREPDSSSVAAYAIVWTGPDTPA